MRVVLFYALNIIKDTVYPLSMIFYKAIYQYLLSVASKSIYL